MQTGRCNPRKARRIGGDVRNAVAWVRRRLIEGAIPLAFPKVSFLHANKLISLALLCLLATPLAGAKCPFIGYSVNGTVTDEDAKAIAGAKVGITSVHEFFPPQTVIATTNERGEYQTQMRFDTYSGGGVNGDDCFRKPSRVNVRVEAAGHNPASNVATIGEDARAIADLVLVRSPQ
ncbi:MAG: carboxypeptidase-like regulatory domain-containing protein [Betaproteobacteria bacterium]